MDPVRTYDYLVKTRERVFDSVRALTPEQYARSVPFGLKTFGSTLTHVMISEWYYVERMAERAIAPYAEWPIKDENPPAFEVIERTWREQAPRTRAAVAAERDWSRRIAWLSFPDPAGRRFHISASAGDFFTQLAFHEVHHRAQVMAMIKLLGQPAAPVGPVGAGAKDGAGVPPIPPLEDLDFNALMFERIPAEP